MPAANPLHTVPVCAMRAVCACAGIFLLLLQLLGPALASPGQSMWIEICSEAGAVWVEVDLEEPTDDPTAPCPKCADCALCAITATASLPDQPVLTQTGFAEFLQSRICERVTSYRSERLWPETRGPPFAAHEKTERALRAPMAPTQIPGGVSWS